MTTTADEPWKRIANGLAEYPQECRGCKTSIPRG